VLKVELDGEYAGTAAGLALAASNITVQGLVINRFANDGIYVSGNADVIQGNFLGTDVTGTQALGNHGNDVEVQYSSDETIGGTAPAARNIISGALPATSGPYVYGDGIFMIGDDQRAVVQGNFIGTDVTGKKSLGNASVGIDIQGEHELIGGHIAGAGNLISGNGSSAILTQDPENMLEGNFIGTDVTGTQALGNDDGANAAVFIDSYANTVGGTAAGAGNLISGNQSTAGLRIEGNSNNVVEGNFIGTDVTGQVPLGNRLGILLRADGNTIGGTDAEARNIISGGQNDFEVDGSRNVIQGNFIGTNIDGTRALGGQYTGVGISGADNTVGGTCAGARNVISGWQFGEGAVVLNEGATGNMVEGNYIGTDATGEVPLGNGTGVLVAVASANTITGNVISGCTTGVKIYSNGQPPGLTSGNVVQGNQIGTDATGTQVLGNGSYGVQILDGQGTQVTGNVVVGTGPTGDNFQGSGVVLSAGTFGNTISGNTIASNAGNGVYVDNSAFNNTVRGTAAGAGNTIAANGGDGVLIREGIGGGATWRAYGIAILGNSIHDNAGLGIDLHIGVNNNQAAPLLTSAITSATGTAISGTLANYPNSSFRIEFFTNPPGVSSEGQTFVGFAQVTTDPQGNFTASLPSLPLGTNLTATATVATPNGDGTYTYGDTSEFAANTTVKSVLSVTTYSNLTLAGKTPPPLTGSVNGTPFTGSITITTTYGDTLTITLTNAATSASPVGQYTIGANMSGANSGNYILNLTAGTMYVVSLGADPDGSGAQAVTFWDNKRNKAVITGTDLSSLDALNLVNQGGAAFDPNAVAQLQAWLSVSPNATTSYQLAVQLATMDLNVLASNVHAADLLYAGGLLSYANTYGITGLTSGGFIDVQDLMNAANAILARDPKAGSGDPNQAYEAALAQALQAANGNTVFVQPPS
jgi:titin